MNPACRRCVGTAFLPTYALTDLALAEETGTLAFVRGPEMSNSTFVWVERDGHEEPLALEAQHYRMFELSPDGQRLLVEIYNGHLDLWIYDFVRTQWRLLTLEGINVFPVWSPDGLRVAFTSHRSGAVSAYSKVVDGSGEAEELTTGDYFFNPTSWSSDGRLLAGTVEGDIWIVRPESGGEPEALMQTPFTEKMPIFSPDGRWIAYTSDESGRDEVYVQAFPPTGHRWAVSSGGGSAPRWSETGDDLFYRSGDRLMTVPVAANPDFMTGRPDNLFEVSGQHAELLGNLYDVTSDGQRFLFLKGPEHAPTTQIHVALNLIEQLGPLSRAN